MRRPDLRFARRSLAAGRQQRVALVDVLGLHEQLREGLVSGIGRRRREHQLEVGGYLELAVSMTGIGDRQAADLGVVLGGHDDLQRRRDRPVRADEFRPILGERDLIGLGLDAARLIAGRPYGAAHHVAQEEVASVIVARDIFAPTCHPDVPPSAVARTGAGQHHRVSTVAEQMSLRQRVVRVVQTAHLGKSRLGERRGGSDLLRARVNRRDIARRAFLQEQFRRLNARLGVKPRPHPAVEDHIGDGDDAHSLVMRHVGPNDGDRRPVGDPRARVVEGLVEPIAAARADSGKPLEIAHRALRVDHRGERRCIRRDHRVRAQPALEPEPRDTEVRILVGELEIARVVGRFGNSPRDPELGGISDLQLHDQPAGLIQEAAGRRAHHQRRHEVLEHGAGPGNERGTRSDRRHRSAEAEPVAGRDVVLRDGDEARQSGFRGEQVVTIGVQAPIPRAADRQEPALPIEQEAEFHLAG